MNKKIRYYSMFHRGGLDESLKTKTLLYEDEFLKLFKQYNYCYYCYDDRINCIRFIKGNLVKNSNIPTWLLIELVDSK